MRFRATLVRPLADQGDRDGLLIDPAGVEFTEGRDYPVTAEFDYGNVVGKAVLRREADGSIVADCDLGIDDAKGLRLAAGIASHAEHWTTAEQDRIVYPGRRVVRSCRLNAIGLTPSHSDPGQPEIERVE